jgi:hypothetical protein
LWPLVHHLQQNNTTLCLSWQQKESIAIKTTALYSTRNCQCHHMFLLVALLVVMMGLQGIEQGCAFQSIIATTSTLQGEAAHLNKAHNNNPTMLSVAVGRISQFCHGTPFSQSTTNSPTTAGFRLQNVSQN